VSTRQAHRIRTSAAGALLGLIALVLVAAILGGALSAIRANETIDSLAGQLTAARHQIDALRDDNTRLEEQNRQILEQNRTLVTYLRRHGLEIPQTAVPTPPPASAPVPSAAGGGPGTDPKGPALSESAPSPSRSPHPSPSPPGLAGPAPTATRTPLAPGLEGLCDLALILCTP
jgi:type II secretory pathway pseudopilin PulG